MIGLSQIIHIASLWELLIFAITGNVTLLEYCDGWDKGYKEGYCYEVQNCIEPIVPTCPIPKIGFETYMDGYNRGFIKGKEDRK